MLIMILKGQVKIVLPKNPLHMLWSPTVLIYSVCFSQLRHGCFGSGSGQICCCEFRGDSQGIGAVRYSGIRMANARWQTTLELRFRLGLGLGLGLGSPD